MVAMALVLLPVMLPGLVLGALTLLDKDPDEVKKKAKK